MGVLGRGVVEGPGVAFLRIEVRGREETGTEGGFET